MGLFIGVLSFIILTFALVGPCAAGMSYNWRGWTIVWFTVFNALTLAAIGGYLIDHSGIK